MTLVSSAFADTGRTCHAGAKSAHIAAHASDRLSWHRLSDYREAILDIWKLVFSSNRAHNSTGSTFDAGMSAMPQAL
jgi:hypothetical protein